MTDPTILPIDREAAADAIGAYRGNKNHDWQNRVRTGQADDGYMVLAFARHREQGRADGDAAERAAIIAWFGADCEHPNCSPCRESRVILKAIQSGAHHTATVHKEADDAQ